MWTDRKEGMPMQSLKEEQHSDSFKVWMCVVGGITPGVSCVDDAWDFRMEVAATIMSTSLEAVPFNLTAMAIASWVVSVSSLTETLWMPAVSALGAVTLLPTAIVRSGALFKQLEERHAEQQRCNGQAAGLWVALTSDCLVIGFDCLFKDMLLFDKSL